MDTKNRDRNEAIEEHATMENLDENHHKLFEILRAMRAARTKGGSEMVDLQ